MMDAVKHISTLKFFLTFNSVFSFNFWFLFNLTLNERSVAFAQ